MCVCCDVLMGMWGGVLVAEEHENIITGDGSVTYMIQGKTPPEAILADNPNAKVVFALRYAFNWQV